MKPSKSAVFTAIIAVGTGLLSWFIRNQYTQVLQGHDLLAVAVYTGVFVVLVVAVASLDKLLTWIWNRSIRYRYFWAWISGQPFIEGSWVDVGIDSSGNYNRLLNYSSILISRSDDKYSVEGISWDFHGTDEVPWYSEHCEFKDHTLTFWYTGGRPGSENDKAEYHFSKGPRSRLHKFEGKYGDGNFRTEGELNALVLTQDRKSVAEQHMREFQRLGNYDDHGIQLSLPTGSHHVQRDWYRVFLRRSDKADKEASLLRRALSNAHDRRIDEILDIGPGEGTLTRHC